MQQTDQSDERWQPCRKEISQLTANLKRKRRVHQARQVVALGGIVVCALLGYSLIVDPSPSPPDFGNIRCTDVIDMASAYLAGQLDAPIAARIRQHLTQCAQCRRQMLEMLRDTADGSVPGIPVAREAPTAGEGAADEADSAQNWLAAVSPF
jgi:hypothetical protein